MLPLDAIVGSTYDKNYVKYKLINDIDANDIIFDIGTKTLEKYKKALSQSKTVFLNGTVGFYEDVRFANGTKELLNLLVSLPVKVIVGGGDAASSVRSLGLEDSVTYLSSGGGASLEYLASGSLIALDAMEDDAPLIEVLEMD